MRGGKRPGSGRKKKSDEVKLIECLDNIIDSDLALNKLKELIERGNIQAIKLYLSYRFGIPTQINEVDSKKEQPLFSMTPIEFITT